MDQWISVKNETPSLRDPVWGYACDGTLLLVCRLYEYNDNSKWDLGKAKAQCWCVLRSKEHYEEGELLPLNFITEWAEFKAEMEAHPAIP